VVSTRPLFFSGELSMAMVCYWPIADLPGLDPKLQGDLAALGLLDTKQLLALTAPQQIAVAADLGLPLRHLQKPIAMANLAQVPSVGCDYCGLLLHAGIASLDRLSQMNVQQLHRSILRLHVGLLQRRDLTPTVDRVQKWVQQAQQITNS
jgi:Domain of unknown function (DUF4332)